MVKRKAPLRKAPAPNVGVPKLEKDTNYEVWKEDLKRWTRITSVLPCD